MNLKPKSARRSVAGWASEVISNWLERRRKRAEYKTLRRFAEAHAGTDWDLDPASG